MNNTIAIEEHYKRCWGADGIPVQWEHGPCSELPPIFRILVFSPTERRNMWTYATCGMSQQPDAVPIELHLFSPINTIDQVELLTVLAHYHLTGSYLDVGHTVNFGRPWLPNSLCKHGLISLPYLDGPKLEWLDVKGLKVRFLWLVPITDGEVAFKQVQGLEALESRFEATNFNYLDANRGSVVE